jgi:hypothetical protein
MLRIYVDKYLGSFQFFTSTDNAAVNILRHVSMSRYVKFSRACTSEENYFIIGKFIFIAIKCQM